MFRITRMSEDEGSATLKVEGWVTGPWAAELRKECERYLARRHTVILELSGVRFADRRGIQALKAARRRGVRLCGASSFLSRLLGEVEDER